MKKFLVVISLLIVTVNLKAGDSVDSMIVSLKVDQQEALNQGDMDKFTDIANKLERLSTFGEKEWLIHYYLSYNYYRMSTISEDEEASGKYIEQAKKWIEKSLEEKGDFAESHILYSSVLGFEIGINPRLAMTNGVKSVREVEKAQKLDDKNPRAYLVDGMMTLNRPSMFGGGADRALPKLNKAVELFNNEEDDMGIYPEWGEDEVYIWLGITYEKKEDKSKALEYYRKALEVNPENGWAKQMIARLEVEEEE